MTAVSAIRVDQLQRSHGGTPVLHGLSAAIPQGSYTVVVGPSGAGKTTLLRLLAGLDFPDRGDIWFGDRRVTSVDAEARDVGWVPQGGALLPHLDVGANLGLGLELRRAPRNEIRERVVATARLLGLSALLSHNAAHLSAGERQRVALGRALMRDPGILLLDEPLANLDPHLRSHLRTELRRHHDPGRRTVLHVTHDPSEALALGDQILVLREGRLEQAGTPEDVFARPETPFVAGFFGQPPMNLIPGRVSEDGGAFHADTSGWGPGIPDAPRLPAGPVSLGLRPESLQVAPHSGQVDVRLEGKVVAREYAGHEIHLTLVAEGHPWRLRCPPHGGAGTVEFGFNWADCHWFAGVPERRRVRPR